MPHSKKELGMNTKDGQNDGWSLTKDPPFGDPLGFLNIAACAGRPYLICLFRKLKHGTPKQFKSHKE